MELFEKGSNGRWSKFQELATGQHEDNFGNSIQILGDRVIIGANAPYTDNLQTYENKDIGRAYVYKLENMQCRLESELHSNSSRFDDRFGTAVCFVGDYALVNNITEEPIQVFKQDGNQWIFHQVIKLLNWRSRNG